MELRLQRPVENALPAALGATARLALAGLARRGLDLRPPLRAIRDAVAPLSPTTPPPTPTPPVALPAPSGAAPPPIASAPAAPLTQDWLARRVEMLERLLLASWPAALPERGTLVSVVMPVRDRAGLVGAAIESVKAQRYQDWELLIVDDGSTDGTAAEVALHLSNPRITYSRQEAAGAPAARNAALARAKGPLIAYLDSDNQWEPDFLLKIVPAFADLAVQCAYGALIYADAKPAERRVLWDDFDRARLEEGNFIDLNVLVHRSALFAQHGRFDTVLKRLADWDLILRFTEAAPALPVPVLATRYRTDAPNRLSDTELYHPAYRRIRAKSRRAPMPARPLRVLYMLWHYPQASEMYVEAEIAAMRRRGVHVEVWSEVAATTPYASETPVHRGTLEAAIEAVQPDVIHAHWLNIAANHLDAVAARGLKLTVRGHGFDVTPESVQRLAEHSAVHTVYLYEQQIASLTMLHSRVVPIRNAFETTLFQPGPKNPRLVFRAAAALPAKDLPMFLQIAKRFPEHRFVLAIVACNLMESYVGALLALRREMESPCEVLVNLPHADVATLMREAGIYLHTVMPPAAGGTPLGQPTSIAEAMASSCYVLARDLPPLNAYVMDAGDAYADADVAAALIAATTHWDAPEWARRARLSEERGWTYFSGDDTFHRMHEDWAALAQLTPT